MRDLESNGVSGLHLKKRELSNGASNHTVFHDCNYQYHLQIKSSVVIIIMIAIKSVIIAINQSNDSDHDCSDLVIIAINQLYISLLVIDQRLILDINQLYISLLVID